MCFLDVAGLECDMFLMLICPGIVVNVTAAVFNKHFGKYGEITDSVIMRDRHTGKPRGFGFITYADPCVVDKVIEDHHIINGKQVLLRHFSLLFYPTLCYKL